MPEFPIPSARILLVSQIQGGGATAYAQHPFNLVRRLSLYISSDLYLLDTCGCRA